ncbi:MAG: prepilin-type N-terminal cleavage/methylation domain-containing protein [Microthrixaceae bacterium]
MEGSSVVGLTSREDGGRSQQFCCATRRTRRTLSRARRRSLNNRPTQGGFSLIEVLVALAIASAVVVGLASGLLALIRTDTSTAEQQKVQLWLGSYSESIKAAPYRPCHLSPDAATPQAYFDAYKTWDVRWEPPAGVTLSVTRVEYWDKASADFIDTCGAMDQGTQRLNLQIKWRDIVSTAQVVKAPRL